MKLRPCQEAAVQDALAFLASAKPGDKKLYAAPTGSGKSIIELAVQRQAPYAWLVTPKVEIIMGMMNKLDISTRVIKTCSRRPGLNVLQHLSPLGMQCLEAMSKLLKR